MKLELDGAFDVSASPQAAFALLADPQRFAPLLPMFKELKDVTEAGFTVVLEVGVPQIRGRLETRVKRVAATPITQLRYSSNARHALGMADSTFVFDIAPAAASGGARVAWKSESLVRGTLASLANGILMPLAKRNVEATVESIRKELGAVEAPAATAAPSEPTALDPVVAASSASTSSAPVAPVAQGAPTAPAAPRGLVARFFAWLAALVGGDRRSSS